MDSNLKVNGIFEESNSNRLAIYFTYQWTLKNGKKIDFEVVDILVFDKENKIVDLKIIYDTFKSRSAVESVRREI